ncbi:MAG: hypothetical protein U0804_19775 [Gemmataceae bacterium]
MGQKLGDIAAGVFILVVGFGAIFCMNLAFDRVGDALFKKPSYQARPVAPVGGAGVSPVAPPAPAYRPAPQSWNDRPKSSRMCYTCSGSGNRTCGNCYGSGRDSGKVCSVCNGRGSSGSCGLCSGTGRVTD